MCSLKAPLRQTPYSPPSRLQIPTYKIMSPRFPHMDAATYTAYSICGYTERKLLKIT